MIDGILCIDKPQSWTSFDVIAKLRGILKTRKLGHAGTLDPMATGVLPVFIGRATKACDMLPNQGKRYTATFRLGLVTDTQDITGTVLSTAPVEVTEEQILQVASQFQGEIAQLPPMYSAVQVGGKRLYELARKGIEVERAPRPVHIYALDVLTIQNDMITIDVHCSKGTYIRTLCHDIGDALGCGATLTALRRTMAAGFTQQDCLTLEQAAQAMEEGNVEEHILPIGRVFSSLPKVELTENQTRLYCNGVKLYSSQLPDAPQGAGKELAVYDHLGSFLGVSYWNDAGELVLQKLFRVNT